mmetsp:Transcript_20572/g.49476  ORF Transcript_20572/g.49476 Transcript_20572/m.49476 type:complete len:194 (+) Transcript_20572:1245-1826(+)|eukprot:CAMPEP_0181134472 /NCGR_PEP_ID=MMETSP1071-20121207/32107_1 /TAXON_ID=35127 /ORGANISM="Thalassiosira sp., Strain NH16" /LENGTH=193 /DNA_ID=CAMNT_0023220995 /DNA_START=1788 /DNA_END=2369 /DNA_ORIENTATION=+
MGQPDHRHSFDSLAAVLMSSDSEEDNDSLLKTPPQDEISRKVRAVRAEARRPSKMQTFRSRRQEIMRNSPTAQQWKAIMEGSEGINFKSKVGLAAVTPSENESKRHWARSENKFEHGVTRAAIRAEHIRASEGKANALLKAMEERMIEREAEREARMTKNILDAISSSRPTSVNRARTGTRKRKASARIANAH